jgi:hypothetical protein
MQPLGLVTAIVCYHEMKTLNQKISQLLYDVDGLEERLSFLSSFDSATELFAYAEVYNWDDGFDIPRAIAEHTYCDQGTALLLFWLADPIPYITNEIERNDFNKDWFDFCEFMSHRLKEGYDSMVQISYDPELTKVQKYKLTKLGVDPVLLSSRLND